MSFTQGGLVALILKLARDGHEKLFVIGPPGTTMMIHALRHLIRWTHPQVVVREFNPLHGSTPIFEDERLLAFPLTAGGSSLPCPRCLLARHILENVDLEPEVGPPSQHSESTSEEDEVEEDKKAEENKSESTSETDSEPDCLELPTEQEKMFDELDLIFTAMWQPLKLKRTIIQTLKTRESVPFRVQSHLNSVLEPHPSPQPVSQVSALKRPKFDLPGKCTCTLASGNLPESSRKFPRVMESPVTSGNPVFQDSGGLETLDKKWDLPGEHLMSWRRSGSHVERNEMEGSGNSGSPGLGFFCYLKKENASFFVVDAAGDRAGTCLSRGVASWRFTDSPLLQSTAVFHLSALPIMRSPGYSAWVHGFGPSVTHVALRGGGTEPGFQATNKQHALLNLVSPEHFPLDPVGGSAGGWTPGGQGQIWIPARMFKKIVFGAQAGGCVGDSCLSVDESCCVQVATVPQLQELMLEERPELKKLFNGEEGSWKVGNVLEACRVGKEDRKDSLTEGRGAEEGSRKVQEELEASGAASDTIVPFNKAGVNQEASRNGGGGQEASRKKYEETGVQMYEEQETYIEMDEHARLVASMDTEAEQEASKRATAGPEASKIVEVGVMKAEAALEASKEAAAGFKKVVSGLEASKKAAAGLEASKKVAAGLKEAVAGIEASQKAVAGFKKAVSGLEPSNKAEAGLRTEAGLEASKKVAAGLKRAEAGLEASRKAATGLKKAVAGLEASKKVAAGLKKVLVSLKASRKAAAGLRKVVASLEASKKAAVCLKMVVVGPEGSKKVTAGIDLISETMAAKTRVEEQPPGPFKILILGSGCAEPSKYRGSSGILIQFEHTGRAILADCGTGVVGQLKRRIGQEGYRKLLEGRLAMVWVSHRHADHAGGLLQLIADCHDAGHRLLVVGPWDVAHWIHQSFLAQEQAGINYFPFTFLHCQALGDECRQGLCPGARQAIEYDLHLPRVQSVPVIHCRDSWALIIQTPCGASLAYSGDTRPSPALASAAKDCTLLIHEATYEGLSLQHLAELNRHSTAMEALGAGQQMSAKYILLTHFSQRYPKLVDIDAELASNACIAFDGMVVSASRLQKIPLLLPRLVEALSAIEEEPKANEVATVEAAELSPADSGSHSSRFDDLDMEVAGGGLRAIPSTHIRFVDSDDGSNDSS